MDEKPKSSKRRVQLLWLVVILIELAAYGLVGWLFDVNIILYLIGLNFVIALLRIRKAPLLPMRWGFRVSLIALFGILWLSYAIWMWRWQTKQEGMMMMPDKSYVQMVSWRLGRDISEELGWPNALQRWRTTGKLDTLLIFPRTTLGWFTYDGSHQRFSFYQPDTVVTPMSQTPYWKSIIEPNLVTALQPGHSVWLREVIQSGGRDFYLVEGFWDEPRIVGSLLDLNEFRREMPALFLKARREFPLLEGFTEDPNIGGRQNESSAMSITLIEGRDNVLAQIGHVGSHRSKKDHYIAFAENYYTNSYPFKSINARLNIVVPHMWSSSFTTIMRKTALYFIFTWLITLLLWAKAEIQLSKTKKKLAEREINTRTV